MDFFNLDNNLKILKDNYSIKLNLILINLNNIFYKF
jgi:hypothetical protein